MIRTLIILVTALSLSASLAACGKKGPLDIPPPREHKEKPAE
jgi:predicted small lipoprotein YifL